MQNPIILISEVENGMAKACQLLYHREAADRLFVAEATTCLARGLLIDSMHWRCVAAYKEG